MLDPPMAEALSAIEQMQIPVDSQALRDGFTLQARLDARLVRGLIDWNASGLWGPAGDGAPNLIEWVRHHADLPRPDAARIVHLAHLCTRSPTLLTSWENGHLSTGQIRVIRANVTRELLPTWADHEADLVPLLEPLDVEHTKVAMVAWALRARHDAGIDPPDPDRDRACHLDPTLDSTGRLTANLTPDASAVAHAALRKATDPPSSDDDRTPAQRRHDALADIFAFYLDQSHRHQHSHHRPHLNIIVDQPTLLTGVGSAVDIDSGTTLTAEAARRIACDANLHAVYRAGSTVLDYGRATRSIPAPLFTTVALRDGGCRGPGCTRPPSQTRGHHLHHWTDGGPTRPDNILLLCSYHHWLVHKGRWTVTLHPDATTTWTNPHGRTLHTKPHPRTAGGPTHNPQAA